MNARCCLASIPIAFLPAYASFAQDAPAAKPAAADLVARVAALHQPAALEEAGLTGPGAELLLREGRAAEFVLLGESHGNIETTRVASWLLGALKEAGYRALATETGPCTTAHLVEIAGRDGAPGLVEFMRGNPFSVAFLNWREEVELFADAVRAGYAVWGLDQEFLGSARFLLGQLATRAKEPAARELAETWRDKALAGFAHFAKTGDQSKAFLTVAQPADFAALDAAFAGEIAELRDMLVELRASAEIYGHYRAKRYFENNHDRIVLMKRHLAERLRAAGDARVLLKFGSAHAGRGYSPFDQLDLGNHAAEIAVARGGDSFHVYVFARRSQGRGGASRDFAESNEHLRPFYDAMHADSAAVFDLRPLRPYCSARTVKQAHPELHGLVFRFDALLLLPEFHAATDLIPMPGGK